jgi:hypothetical protein
VEFITLGGDDDRGWDSIWVLGVIFWSTMFEFDAFHELSSVWIIESFGAIVAWGKEQLLPDVVHVVDIIIQVWIFDGSSQKGGD